MSFDKNISIEGVLKIAAIIVTSSFFLSSISSQMSALSENFKEFKIMYEKREEKREKTEEKKAVEDNVIRNQVATNTMQIELLKKDVKELQEKRR